MADILRRFLKKNPTGAPPLRYYNKSIPGVILIEPDIFKDDRGFFMETYNKNRYSEMGIEKVFVQDNHSRSQKDIIRGLHYQLVHPQGKLVYVIKGKILDVAVDIRQGSPTFGRWTGDVLSDQNRQQLYIPEGFAHGFCVLSDMADVIYKCTEVYHPDDEYGILWSDPGINITWPIQDPILSEKDRRNPPLGDIGREFLPGY
ncbi:MAG: dTDP-4-dehydrorhamnose 3,5-epimerase [Deltaproteobacteria bacterium]|nr:dTDP-4-dehydrorhamnose 3,5-epimerase [Deltaproteobacteria bacterium]